MHNRSRNIRITHREKLLPSPIKQTALRYHSSGDTSTEHFSQTIPSTAYALLGPFNFNLVPSLVGIHNGVVCFITWITSAYLISFFPSLSSRNSVTVLGSPTSQMLCAKASWVKNFWPTKLVINNLIYVCCLC